MPSCSIIHCNSRNSKDRRLTLHRFPQNPDIKRKWITSIGIININPRHKDNLFLCSLHFKASDFNETLPHISLHENAIPSIGLMVESQEPLLDNQPDSSSYPLVTQEDICKNATILDEGLKLCPLCQSEVRFFFINLIERIWMCENFDCEYPFGEDEDLTITKVQSVEEAVSIAMTTQCSTSAALLTESTAACSEEDKTSWAYEADDHLDTKPDTKECYNHKQNLEKMSKDDEAQIFKKVESLKKISLELSAAEEQENIRNEKWIKNLMEKQKFSGVHLLKPEEEKLLKIKQPDFEMTELKIDIDMGMGNVSSIKIELANNDSQVMELNNELTTNDD